MLSEKPLRLTLLLSAALLRLWRLASVPPGLTHDEADHGLSAWEIVQGARPIYLTVGNGREPLYDYFTALFMALTRPSFLIGRLTAVFFSLLLLAAAYALIKKIGSPRLALLTTAGLAVGFWPLMASRQALRSGILPFFVVMAVYFWWGRPQNGPSQKLFLPPDRWSVVLAGLFLGASFYTYLAARVMWLLLPAMLLYWLWAERDRFQAMWRPTVGVLLLAGLLSAPLWLYLVQNPAAEQRVGQLTETLDQTAQGDFAPLATTVMDGIRLIPFKGDSAWRYNIPDRPLLAPLMAVLWGVGLVLVAARLRHRPHPSQTEGPVWQADLAREVGVLAIIWLLLGLIPVFITGRFLANTQAIGVLPIVYFFPAVALDWMLDRSDTRSPFARAAVGLVFVVGALTTAQSYFFEWGQHPEVRLQYEAPLVELINHLNDSGRGVYAIANPTPGRYHSQPLGLLMVHNPTVSLSFFDGRSALYIPAAAGTIILPASGSDLTSLLPDANRAAAFNTANPDHLFNFYPLEGPVWVELASQLFAPPPAPVTFDGRLQLRGVMGPAEPLPAGGDVAITTWWTVEQAADVDLVLFTQLLGEDGLPITQVDRLDVPANGWAAGAHVVQRHILTIPAATPAGEYALITGFYDPATNIRLTTAGSGATVGQDTVEVGRIRVLSPES